MADGRCFRLFSKARRRRSNWDWPGQVGLVDSSKCGAVEAVTVGSVKADGSRAHSSWQYINSCGEG